MLDFIKTLIRIKIIAKVTIPEVIIATIFLKADRPLFNALTNFSDIDEITSMILSLIYADNKEQTREWIHRALIQKA